MDNNNGKHLSSFLKRGVAATFYVLLVFVPAGGNESSLGSAQVLLPDFNRAIWPQSKNGKLILEEPLDPPHPAPRVVIDFPTGTTVGLTVPFGWHIENPAPGERYQFELLLDKGVNACDEGTLEDSFSTDTLTCLIARLPEDRYAFDPDIKVSVDWGVRATDSQGNAICTEGRRLVIDPDLPPTPPCTPALVSPSNADTVKTATLNLVWRAILNRGVMPADPDTYFVQVATIENFESTIVDLAGVDTSAIPDGLVDSKTYYWRVRAGNEGGRGDWSAAWSFVTINSPPSAPEITSPENGEFIVNGGSVGQPPEPRDKPSFVVTWTEATDPDGDPITYTWELAAAEDFAVILFSSDDLGTDTTFVTTIGKVDELLAAAGVGTGESIMLWHRAVASDGQHSTPGPAAQVTLLRGAIEDEGTRNEAEAEVPSRYKLYQNYPNPFNPVTTIAYELPQMADVRLVVYDLSGREVTTLVQDTQTAGRYEVTFEADGLASGVYFYRIEAGDFQAVQRMLLVK